MQRIINLSYTPAYSPRLLFTPSLVWAIWVNGAAPLFRTAGHCPLKAPPPLHVFHFCPLLSLHPPPPLAALVTSLMALLFVGYLAKPVLVFCGHVFSIYGNGILS